MIWWFSSKKSSILYSWPRIFRGNLERLTGYTQDPGKNEGHAPSLTLLLTKCMHLPAFASSVSFSFAVSRCLFLFSRYQMEIMLVPAAGRCYDATFWWWWCLLHSFLKRLTKSDKHSRGTTSGEWEFFRSNTSACERGAEGHPWTQGNLFSFCANNVRGAADRTEKNKKSVWEFSLDPSN